VADRSPKEKAQIDPSPKNPALLGWLEGLFYGPSDYPQKLEVRMMWGARHQNGGPVIKQILFPPNMIDPAQRVDSDEKVESSGKTDRRKHKPNREELVEISHDILARIQLECDATGKAAVYYVLATHLLRDDQPYERFPIRANPKGGVRRSEDGEDDDELGETGSLKKGYLQGMVQNREMFTLLGSMIEGLVDRQDRALIRAEEALEATRTQNLRMQDVVAKAMDINSERTIKEEWAKLKVRTVERGLNMFEAFAPQMMPGLLNGKNGGGITDSPESLTLKAFLRGSDEGGRLTKEQVDQVFGAFDDEPEMNLIRPGVLTEDQGRIIYQVARLEMHAQELEKLVPGGEHALTQEQLMRLQGVFKDSMDQIAPIIGLFGMVMQKAQARQAQQEKIT
jgi:hypothetical protein